jgi:type IV secretion system protein VirB2
MNMKKVTQSFFTVLALAVTVMLPELAAAGPGGGNPIGETLCNVVTWFDGPVGGGIATLAIIIIGIGALMGKVSWGMAIIVGLGVAVVFGAAPLIAELTGNGTTC